MPYSDPEKAAACKRRYYERNKQLCVDRAAAHAAKDPERERIRLRQWARDNREKRSEYAKQYRKEQREKIAADKKAYRLANPGLWASYCAKRRALKRRAIPSWANFERIDALYVLASSAVGYEVDHIVPLNSALVCGLHCEANLQVISKIENRLKHNRWWPDMP